MKCILKALAETEFKPREKWWGYLDPEGRRHLMRYHHRFVVFQETPFRKILFAHYETRTDKAGVEFAIQHFLSKTMFTFALIKPSAFPNHIAEIQERIKNAGFEIEGVKLIETPDTAIVEKHLAELKEKNHAAYVRNVKALSAGPVAAMVIQYPKDPENVVEAFRELVGPTDPSQAKPNQIRALSDDSLEKAGEEDRAIRNLIHASDSEENAKIERSLWI